MRARRRQLVAFVSVVAMAGLAVLTWRWNAPAVSVPLPRAVEESSTARTAPPVPVGAASATRSTVVFPSPDTPVAERIEALLPAAEAGDARAACRVVAELMLCRVAEKHVQNKYAEAVSAARGALWYRLEEDSDLDAALVDIERACRAVPPERHVRAGALLASAARAGNVEATLQYVQGHFLLRRNSDDFMANPEFERWRRDAPGMLEQLLRAGVPEAALLMATVHSGNAGLADQLIEDDPVRAVAAAHLLRRLAGRAQTHPLRQYDAATRRRGEALAAAWHREYFDGRVLPEGEPMRRINWLPRELNASFGGEWREPCTD